MHTLEELRSQILLAPHPDMEPHVRRGAFIVIHPSLDLAEVAFRMQNNDEAYVSHLISMSFLAKASPEELPQWRESKTFFRFIIVQPWVIAQVFDLKASESTDA